VEISDGAIIKSDYKLCAEVVSKSKTPSRVTPTRDSGKKHDFTCLYLSVSVFY
jgi:hypothetical protein